MHAFSHRALITMAILITASSTPTAITWAQAAHPVPQSLQIEHQETIERLSFLAKRPGAVGVEARKALEIFKHHIARENEFILPALSLLPVLADGKVTPDMRWALTMSDRVRSEREEIFQEHTRVTAVLNALVTAARRAHDKEAVEFGLAAAGDSLNDLEVLEPTVLMIGDYLRAKLPAAQ